MNVLIFTPYPLYRRWPTTPDTSRIINNAAPATLPQLAASIPGHEARLFDGSVHRMSLRRFADMIRWADVVAMNVMSPYAALNTELNVRFIRRLRPEIPIVLGGHHATFLDREWIERGVDAVVRREGEITFPALLEALRTGTSLATVNGVTWRDHHGQVRRNPERPLIANLDDVPIPRWDLVNFHGYRTVIGGFGKAACVETSRGCEHHCVFCQVGPMWRHTHRYRSPERVIEELKFLASLGVGQLFVCDDNYGSIQDADRQSRIYEGMRKAGLRMLWGSFCRHDFINAYSDLVREAVASGLRYVCIGFESVESADLERFQKDNRAFDGVESYVRAYEFLHGLGVLVFGFFVLGYPGQDEAGVRRIFDSRHRFCDYPVVTLFVPHPGTVGYRQTVRAGLLDKDIFYHDSQVVAVRGTESTLREYNRAFLRFLANPARLLRLPFDRHPSRRAMEQAVYRWFMEGFLHANRQNVADFLWFLLRRPRVGGPVLFDHLRARYLCDENVERLVRKVSA